MFAFPLIKIRNAEYRKYCRKDITKIFIGGTFELCVRLYESIISKKIKCEQ